MSPPAGHVPGSYAFGLSHYRQNGRSIIGHEGSIAGFSSAINTYVDEDLTVIVLSNTSYAAPSMEREIAKIIENNGE